MKRLLVFISLGVFFICMLFLCATHKTHLLPPTDVRLFDSTRLSHLAFAVNEEDTILLKKILEDNTDLLNDVDMVYGLTVLNQAVYNDKIESAKILLRYGANPSLKNKAGNNAIIDATLAGKCDFLKMFSNLCDDQYREAFFYSLYYCVLYDNPQSDCAFDFLLDNVCLSCDTIGMLLCAAIDNNRYDMALRLLDNGAVFNDSIEFQKGISNPKSLKYKMSIRLENNNLESEKKIFIDSLLKMGLYK